MVAAAVFEDDAFAAAGFEVDALLGLWAAAGFGVVGLFRASSIGAAGFGFAGLDVLAAPAAPAVGPDFVDFGWEAGLDFSAGLGAEKVFLLEADVAGF